MDKYTCIIIEDEPLALEKTKDFVHKVPFLHLSGTFDNALTGLAFLNNNKVDLLFLDINMDELSGIELLESSKIKSACVSEFRWDICSCALFTACKNRLKVNGFNR